MVEHLDEFVVRAGFREQLGGCGECLARPGGGTEAGLWIRLEEGRHHLPQRLGYAPGRGGCAVLGEVLDQRLGVRLGAFQEVEGDQAHGEQVRGKSGSDPNICSGAK